MRRFKNILVGVDLSGDDRFVADAPGLPSERAVEQALWLAALNGARVTFLYAVDVSPQAQSLLAKPGVDHSVVDEASDALNRLVEHARQLGVAANSKVALGHPWSELIAQVQSEQHDLVVVGSGRHFAITQVLFGTTGMKLLRKCPCPVWITKPKTTQAVEAVLVAHDLSPVGTLALQLGASIAQLQHSELHVLHAMEEHPVLAAGEVVVENASFEETKAAARSRILSELEALDLGFAPHVEIQAGDAVDSILQYIADHPIGLLAMGTVARSGIDGMISGNTAERLLTKISCSLLVVKPADFMAPTHASS